MGRRLFIDLDGVMGDFNGHYRKCFGMEPPKLRSFDKDGHDVDWRAIQKYKDFYLSMPPMPDMRALWDYVKRWNPPILTGIPSSVVEAQSNKIAWVRLHLGPDVQTICCRSKEKYLQVKTPGDTLVDDWEKYKSLWEGAGGEWITHVNAERSIELLKEAGWK